MFSEQDQYRIDEMEDVSYDESHEPLIGPDFQCSIERAHHGGVDRFITADD